MTPKEVLTLVREKEIKAIDLRFVDFPGTWQHFTIPANMLEESTFEDGLGFIHGGGAISSALRLALRQLGSHGVPFRLFRPSPSRPDPGAMQDESRMANLA